MNENTQRPSIRDTTWKAVQMGSEGWAVFAGPRMIASNQSKVHGSLIAAALDMLEALEALANHVPELWGDEVKDGYIRLNISADAIDKLEAAIQKARA